MCGGDDEVLRDDGAAAVLLVAAPAAVPAPLRPQLDLGHPREVPVARARPVQNPEGGAVRVLVLLQRAAALPDRGRRVGGCPSICSLSYALFYLDDHP